jgi:hypothetical protein
MPPSLTAGGQWRRGKPAHLRIAVALVQFDAAFENVPQTGKDRLVGAAGRFPDPLPIAFAGVTREPANEAGGEQAACEVPLLRVVRNASREITPDRGDRRAGDVRIRAGPDDLSDDHGQRSFSLGRHASYANRICSQRVIARKILFISRKSTFRQHNVNDLSYCDLALQHEKLDFCFLFMTIVLENLFHTTLVA